MKMFCYGLLALIIAFAYQVVESSDVGCLPCKCTGRGFGLVVICKVDNMDALISTFDTFRDEQTKITYLEIFHPTATELPDGLLDDLVIKDMQFHLPKLENLPSYTFESQKDSLTMLTFMRASFASVPFEAIAPLKKLQFFSISENRGFTHIPSSSNSTFTETVEAVFYHFDQLKTIARNAFSNYHQLKHLSFAQNQLTNIDSVVLPGTVSHLYAGYNKLTSFPAKMLSSLGKGSEVKMNYNRIANFSPEDVAYISKRKYSLQILVNPINCNCSFKDLAIDRTYPQILGSCKLPNTLSGKFLDKLTAKDFKNC